MALGTNQLFVQNAVLNSPGRWSPDEDGAQVKTLAAHSGAPTLPCGTPLAVNSSTGKWVPWTLSGSNATDVIRGFVYPDPVVLSATTDTQSQVFMRGSVWRDDINTAAILAVCDGSPADTDLDAALKFGAPSLRELGIDVLGLAGVI